MSKMETNEPLSPHTPIAYRESRERIVISPNHQEWDEQVEEFVKSFLSESEVAKTEHYKKGQWCQIVRNLWGLPPIIIPLLMAPFTQTFKKTDKTSYISMAAFMLSGITSSIGQYFNYGKKSEQHFNTAAYYADLITDIKEEMAKSRNNRREAAVAMSTFKMRFDIIGSQAPNY